MGYASSIVIITLIIFAVIIVTAVIIVEVTQTGCQSDSNCLSTQVCQNRLCVSKVGGSCLADNECAQGLVCRNNVCINLLTIPVKPPPTRVVPPVPVATYNYTLSTPPVNTGVTMEPRVRSGPVELTESDDEVNSCGQYEDAPFAVVSGASSDDKCNNIIIEELTRMYGSLVIDATTYSNYNIYLLRDGKLVMEEISDDHRGTNARMITSTIMLERIVAYDGTIFGVSEGRMYRLALSSLMTPVWQWENESAFPTNIIDVSVTDDEQWLWIQTNQEGYLYHRRTQVERRTYSALERRIYGRDQHHYLELDRELCQGKLYPEQTTLDNVCYGRATSEGAWVTVGLDQKRKYDRIVMLNWRPYFLRRY